MSDLIDRQALRKAMYHETMEKDSDEQKWESGCWIRYKMFERVIDSMPSAEPEIIRCKDCLMHGFCRFEQGLGLDGYCSHAERR